MIIYKTTNKINGKIYVGKDLHNNQDYLGSGKKLKHAIKKYGKENFSKEILEENFITEKEWNEAEKKWIKKLNSRDRKIGYNIAEGGTGGKTLKHPWNYKKKGRKISKEEKEHLSKIMKEKYANGKIKNGMKGKTPWNKGMPLSEKQKKNLSEINKGRKLTEEQKKKMSKAHKGKKPYEMTDEIRKKIMLSSIKNKDLIEKLIQNGEETLNIYSNSKSKADFCRKTGLIDKEAKKICGRDSKRIKYILEEIKCQLNK